jgi:hypothetical protein
MTSVNNTNILQTKYDCEFCNYHTSKKKDYNKHLLTAKHTKNTTTISNENNTTTSNENTTTTSNENTINDLKISNTDLKQILLEMITQQITERHNQQIIEKDELIEVLSHAIFELVELIQNQDGTCREISKNCLSKKAIMVIDEIITNNEKLSIIKANRENRELEATIKAEQEAEQEAEEAAIKADLLAMLNDKDKLMHNSIGLIRQFK